MRRLDWFLIVLVLSLAVRLYLAIFTAGTYDVEIWEKHASGINEIGLTGYYKATLGDIATFNHPPLAGKLMASLLLISEYLHIPFRIIFRLLFSAFDFIAAFYLYKIFDKETRRFYVAFYLLSPLTFIFSAYHGNTDTALGLFILLSIYLISRQKFIAAGIALAVGTYFKWIILLTLPAIFFAIPDIRAKIKYLAAVGIVSLLGYAWYLFYDPNVIIDSVFGYTGRYIQTASGIPIWGIKIIVRWVLSLFNYNADVLIDNVLVYNNLGIFIALMLYSWLRRRRTDILGLGRTVGEVFIIFYALTDYWSFQYFAWCAPFLVFLSLPLMLSTTVFCGGYIYTLYSLVCGSFFLLGNWDFIGHPELSPTVLFFRTSSIAVLLISSIYLFYSAFQKPKGEGVDSYQAAKKLPL